MKIREIKEGLEERRVNPNRKLSRSVRNECDTRRGFPIKRVREEEVEALERRDVPNMAKRRPIGRRER